MRFFLEKDFSVILLTFEKCIFTEKSCKGTMQLDLFKADSLKHSFSTVCDSVKCENNVPAWPDLFGKAIQDYLNANKIKKIRTLSLFSGAGGLDIGFSDVGFEIVESVEIEKKFCDTLELNSGKGKRFPKSKVNCIDIREFSGKGLGKIDFIIGGPPCQTFSAAGRRANGVLGTSDARGVLFKEYVRLLETLSPKGFLFENVYAIVGAQDGKPWQEILRSFSEVGYKLFYRIVDAADYGVPQHRERMIIVGLQEGEFKFPLPTHGPDSIDEAPYYNAETAVEGAKITADDGKLELGGRYGKLLNDIPPGLNYSFYTEEMGHPNPIFAWRSKFSDFLYKADPNVPVRTIKASGGAFTGPLHWDNRFFSYSEYKRLQTFPDDYEISGNRQIAVKQIGNSVPPQLARMMAIAIRQQVFKTRFPFELALSDGYEIQSFRKRKHELTKIYRKKAELAIAALKKKGRGLPDSYNYFSSLAENFSYKEVSETNAQFEVDVVWEKKLSINVYDKGKKTQKQTLHVDIVPNKKPWNIGIEKVELNVYSKQDVAFTVAWKAFERELVDNSIKADLVQLNGYYQYVPKLKNELTISGKMPYGKVLQSVVCGEHISDIVSGDVLCKAWNINSSEMQSAAEFLRKLGYEIRNNNTNPQIEPGNWLIPYSFPTLTPLSVQLRKKV